MSKLSGCCVYVSELVCRFRGTALYSHELFSRMKAQTVRSGETLLINL